MLIIPVVDLLGGQAVHAVAGQREHYQPLKSPLCESADPIELISNYCRLYPFPVIYLADLDAIEGHGSHCSLMPVLLERFPAVTFWVDAGFAAMAHLQGWPSSARLRPVLGSESQTDLNAFATLMAHCKNRLPVLSLDFKAGAFLGPQQLLAMPALWPQDVILMQLDRVGKNQGPDDMPAQGAYDNARLYAAGGVRGLADLAALQAQGYAGVLVASVLHAGRLTQAEITAVMDN